WAAGQAASALASVKLLEERAKAAEEKRGPWPEFAEYACYSCHSGLGQSGWRRAEAYLQGRKPGTLPLAQWYSTVLWGLAPEDPVMKTITELEKLMARPLPDAKVVGEQASRAKDQLEGLLKKTPTGFDRAAVKGLLGRLTAKPVSALDWDEAEQRALAVA